MNEFLTFRRMWTPVIVEAIFIVGAALLIGAGVILVAVGISKGSFLTTLEGFGLALLGPLVLRLWCEAVIVLFKIHEGIERLALQGQGDSEVR